MTRKAKTYFIVIGTAVIALIGVPAWFIFGPPRRLVISKETTHLTEPLTADGQVDYVQATLDRQREGVTPENNAAVPLLLAMWPCDLDPHEQQLVCDEMGIQPPTAPLFNFEEEDDKLEKTLLAWASEKWGVDLSDRDQYDFDPLWYVLDAWVKPWRRDQIPPLAQQIDDQRECLELLHQMAERDHYYFPCRLLFDKDCSLLNCSLLDDMRLGNSANLLTHRAMMYVGEGEMRLAWRDLRAVFQLSRLRCADYSITYAVTTNFCEDVAADGLQQLLSSGRCDRELLDEIDAFLAQLPPQPSIAQILDETDRWATLQNALLSSSNKVIDNSAIDAGYSTDPIWLLQMPIDPNALLQRLNQRLDQLVAITAIDDPQKLSAANDAFQSDVGIETYAWSKWGPTAAATFSQSVRGVYAADVTMRGRFAELPYAKMAQFRIQAIERLLRVAIALEKERLASGEYPASLNSLTASIDLALLEDPYAAGQRLQYERRGEGFLLYSLFENGIDDGANSDDQLLRNGEWTDEDDFDFDLGVDLVFRFPLPQLRLEKPKTMAEEFDLLSEGTMMEEEEEIRESEMP